MSQQATVFGQAELSRAADVVNAALTEMTGATSPRLHLELMVARILVPASDESERGALARVERLERRVGVAEAPASVRVEPPQRVEPVETAKRVEPVETKAPTAPVVVEEAIVEEIKSGEVTAPAVEPVQVPAPAPQIVPGTPVTLQQLRDAWPEVLEHVQQAKLNAWVVLQTAQARNLVDDVLTVTFPSENDVASFKQPNPSGDSVSEYLRSAVLAILGFRPKFIARVEVSTPVVETPPEPTEPEVEPGGWAVAAIPESAPEVAPRVSRAPEPKPVSTDKRYGESVVREMLGASFIEEQPLKPRVIPTSQDD